MSETEVLIIKDEWWVWAAMDLPPSKIPSERVLPRGEERKVIKADAATVRRWRKATRAFERMNREIAEMAERG